VNDRLCLHDFRFQTGNKSDDLTAFRLGHFKRAERESETTEALTFLSCH
jgi:hypothetical protein